MLPVLIVSHYLRCQNGALPSYTMKHRGFYGKLTGSTRETDGLAETTVPAAQSPCLLYNTSMRSTSVDKSVNKILRTQGGHLILSEVERLFHIARE